MNGTKIEILKCLADGDWWTTPEVAEECGLGLTNASELLRRYRSQSLVNRERNYDVPRGYKYRITSVGLERLQNLAPGEKPEPGKPIEIFSANGQHRAQMDLARIAGRRGKCVLLNGQWHTTSGIGAKLAGYQVNGWVWWQYRNDKGDTRPIDDFRES